MMTPELYKSSRVYDFFMKFLGYQNSIDRFLRDCAPDCEPDCRILDAGCGTGLLGLHFLERFPSSQLVATDLEPNFLQATLANARSRGVCESRITAGIADISNPLHMKELDGEFTVLEPESFDLICVGAVVGYAEDTEASIRDLLSLLAPGGYLINIEMNESPTGKVVAQRYQYRNIKLTRMQQVMSESGCEVSASKFRISHLPAKFTRTAITARKVHSVARHVPATKTMMSPITPANPA